MGTLRSALLLECLLLLIALGICSPPQDPIKCNFDNRDCTITNSYGNFSDRSICKAAYVEYPTTEEQLISVVAKATQAKRKMKVATRFSHSIPKLVCPDGDDGLLISTKNLNRVLDIDVKTLTMTVESGVTLRQLIDEAAKAGLALPSVPYWWGLTIGGLMSTGAHGSSLLSRGSAVHDYVVALTIVTPAGPEEGYAKVRRLDLTNRQLNAASVSLGVLGVISKVTLKLQPQFKRSISFVEKDDNDLGDRARSFGYQHEFADITWFPSQRKAIYRVDDRISSKTPGDGLFDRIAFRSTPSSQSAQARKIEENQEAVGDAQGKCNSARQVTSSRLRAAFGLTNNGIAFTGYPVVGFNHRIESTGTCLDSPKDALATACPWDPRINGSFFFQNGLSIRMLYVKSFIQDVQKLVKLEPKALCVLELYSGIVFRYVKASTAYLGKQEDGIEFDITYYRSKDPMTPRLYQGILDEIEQIAVFKYQALPHWGKNRNVAFDGAIQKYRNAEEFLKVKEMYDPDGLFSNEWTDQVLGLKGQVTIIKEGCALEGLCICSEDIHCAPKKGYLCRPGKIYKKARVCTLVTDVKKP